MTQQRDGSAPTPPEDSGPSVVLNSWTGSGAGLTFLDFGAPAAGIFCLGATDEVATTASLARGEAVVLRGSNLSESGVAFGSVGATRFNTGEL